MRIEFIIWVPIALIQITLFSIFLFRSRKGNEAPEETIDIIPIYVYKGKAYWKESGYIMVAPYNNSSIDVKQGSRVDQLNSGLLPSEMFDVIEQLEKA
jgi:hypothetical protein